MAQMELILRDNIEDFVPRMIVFNNRELMTAANNMLTEYKGLVYNETAISQAKEDRATLNKFCEALDKDRIGIKKIYEQPYLKFKEEVDEVIKAIKDVSDEIGTQIKAHDEKKKQIKDEQIKSYYESVVGDLSSRVPFEKIFQEKWLNATASMETVRREIDNRLTQIRCDLEAIDALNPEFKLIILALYFRNLSLSEALTENNRLEKDKSVQEVFVDSQKATSPELPVSAPQNVKTAESAELKVIKFEVEATAAQFSALRQFLLSNKIIYRAIK
jgi:hypothetical protein